MHRPREADLSDLIAALPHPRPFVARLSGGFPFAPCERATASKDEIPKLVCSTPPRSREEQARLTALRDDFSRYARRQPEPRQRHLAALWALAAEGDRGDLDAAIENLEAASRLEPDNGALLSDLAAAFTARAAKTDDARDLVRALDAAERGAQVSPELAEAQWNRAVAREVFVRRSALTAWQAVARLERERGWSEQARHQVQNLTGPTEQELWQARKAALREAIAQGDAEASTEIVERFPAESRELLLREVLGEWSAKVTAGPSPEAGSLLRSAIELARRVAAATRDDLFVEIATELERVGAETSGPSLLHLGEACGALGDGYVAFDEGRYEHAARSFEAARSGFVRCGNPLQYWAEYLALRCAFRRNQNDVVLRAIPERLQVLAARGWLSLEGRLFWLLAASQGPTGREAESVLSLSRALHAFQQAGDRALVAAIRTRLANAWMGLGEMEEAWRQRLQALRAMQFREQDLEYGILSADAAARALDLGRAEAALVFQREEVAAAEQAGKPLQAMLALRHLGALEGRLGRIPEARRSLGEARSQAQRLPAGEQQRFALDQIDVLEATTWRDAEPRRAEELLSPVVERLGKANLRAFLPDALRERALAMRAAGDLAGARSDLILAAEEVESLARDRPAPDHKAALLEASGAVYDHLVEVELERGDPLAALAAAERGKARALLEALGESAPGGVAGLASRPGETPRAPLSERLPRSATFLAFHLGPVESSAWVLRDGRTDHVRLPINRARLRELLARLGQVAKARGESEPLLAELFDLLVRPCLAKLSGAGTLHLVPDKELAQVPFAGLSDRASGRHLIELHALDFVPSLVIAAGLAGERPKPLSQDPRVLILADPELDPELFARVGALRGARREAEAIARTFPRSTLLLGAEATPTALLRGLPRHEIVHVAAHARAAGGSLVRSLFLLSPSPDRDDRGVLRAEELLRIDPGSARLVVLAACSSAGRASNEPTAGLAWPLLSRGVPQVIATLALVDDAAASRLVHGFYSGVRSGLSIAESLRAAQLAALHDPELRAGGDLSWAAFQLFSLLSG